MDKKILLNNIVEIENYLLNTNANKEILNNIDYLKKSVISIYNSKLNNNLYNILKERDYSSSNEHTDSNTSSNSNGDSSNSTDRKSSTDTNTSRKNDSDNRKAWNVDEKGWSIGNTRRSNEMHNNLVNKYVSEIGNNWHLDIIGLSNLDMVLTHGPIVVFGKQLLFNVGNSINSQFNELLLPVLRDIQNVYLPNPYHNALHGATVGHMSKLLATVVTNTRKLKPYEEFGFTLASLGHDAGHPGKTNNFLSNTANPLSLIYNDNSILENYHCSLLFHILRFNYKFYNLIPSTEWEWIRKRIIQLILSTDMKFHFNHIDNVKNKRLNNEFNIVDNDDDYWFLLVLCIKIADIGHNFLPWIDHLLWTYVLFEEFYIQGDEERLLNIPLLLFFDRNQANNIPNSQLSFFNSFTQPLLIELTYFDNNNFINNVLLKNSKDNLENWSKYSGRNINDILKELEEKNVKYSIEDAFI